MKVLLIDVNCKQSSTGKVVYDLYSSLSSKGHEAAICYGRGELVLEHNIYKFGLDWETKLHALLTRVTGFTGCFSFYSTRRLLEYIDTFGPDIVHIHELHAYFVNIKPLLRYLTKKNIKTLFTLHCEFNYTGKCGHSYECLKWKTGCNRCPHLHDYPKVLFFDQTNYMYRQKKELFENLPNAIFTTPSPWLTARAKESFLKNNKFFTIYNGVDTTVFYPKKSEGLRVSLGITEEKVIVSVAPNIMTKEKGGQFIIDIAARMRDCKFVLVGTDSDKIEKKDNMIFVPKIVNQNKLAMFYSLGDVFVICSAKETFSLTCAEALCCGLPVAGFQCGAPEMIFEEPYAIFSEYGNVDELIECIKTQLKLSTEDVAEYGKKFSRENMIEKYTKLYEIAHKIAN